MAEYKRSFYINRYNKTKHARDRILDIVFEKFSINSVVDVGCGVGSWLKASENKGIENLVGLEGEWIDPSLFVSSGDLIKHNFELPIRLDNRFDLAISLEVAEHISEENASRFVEDLTLLSDIVLFSAAVPGQGGNGHINEQPQSYWIKKFGQNDYECLDIVRKVIWNDKDIDFWYKQNIFIFRKCSPQSEPVEPLLPSYDIIHPELFKIYSSPGVVLRIKNMLGLPVAIFRKILK